MPGTDNYRSYQVVLRTNTGIISIWSRLKSKIIEGPRNGISVIVPAKLLVPGNYQVKLDGVTTGGEARDIAAYTFQVEKK